jgi:protocatechuate 3,4-dioxygenase, alpha subunit
MVPTPSQTVGPFFGFALERVEHPGEGARVEGQVLDGAGAPVSDALLEVMDGEHFARCRTDEEGAFHFSACRAAYLGITVFARGLLRHVNTRMYFPGNEDSIPAEVDAGRRNTLVAQQDGDVLRFDIRLQGKDETVFFA